MHTLSAFQRLTACCVTAALHVAFAVVFSTAAAEPIEWTVRAGAGGRCASPPGDTPAHAGHRIVGGQPIV